MRLPETSAVAKLAKAVSEQFVGEMSAEGGRITVTSKEGLTKAVDITRLQVPPRAPKRQLKGCLFFCQSMVAKTAKTPGFPTRMGNQGIFCFFQGSLIHLQLFLSVLVDLAAQPSPRQKENLLILFLGCYPHARLTRIS